MKYGPQNPLRYALAALRQAKRHGELPPSVIPQRGGIWVGAENWVTYGSPEDLIVMKAVGGHESFRKRTARILRRTGIPVISKGTYRV